MSQAERGLFERITGIAVSKTKYRHISVNTKELKDICAEFEQRLAEAERQWKEYDQACAIHANKEKWLEEELDRITYKFLHVACGNCFEGKSDMDHLCIQCKGTGKKPISAFLKSLIEACEHGDINETCENLDWREIYLEANIFHMLTAQQQEQK